MSTAAGGAIVFVHGICSTVESVFTEMITGLKADPAIKKQWQVIPFNYDWRQKIADSAAQFRANLVKIVAEQPRVIVIAHSMGGLVARYALLGASNIPKIERLIMLGTPNFGAVTTAQLGILSQPFVEMSAHVLTGQYLRKPGIADLTRVYEIFKPFADADIVTDIEYVTIPGTYFHLYRPIWKKAAGADRRMFKGLNIATELLMALSSMVRVNMDKPHDGIVEERSVRLAPIEPGRWNEKRGSRPKSPTYLHVIHRVCDNLTHTELCRHPDIIALVRQLVLTPTLAQWQNTLSARDQNKLTITTVR